MPALVAGVPSPLRSTSAPFSRASLPAVSMALSKVSSVKCLGGVVYFSFISLSLISSTSPTFKSGNTTSSFFFEPYSLRYFVKPSPVMTLPLALNSNTSP